MIRKYIDAALRQVHYELIDDEESYYRSVPGLQGVWASGAEPWRSVEIVWQT